MSCKTSKIRLFKEHKDGPILLECKGTLFNKLELGNTKLRSTDRCNCHIMLKTGILVKILNFIENRAGTYIVGQEYLTQERFYVYPFPSSTLDIYKVSNLSVVKFWPSDFLFKVVCLPLSENNNMYAIFPLTRQLPEAQGFSADQPSLSEQ